MRRKKIMAQKSVDIPPIIPVIADTSQVTMAHPFKETKRPDSKRRGTQELMVQFLNYIGFDFINM